MRVGILTGGGDCPGLNATIRAIVRKGELVHGDELIGFYDAWDGVMERRHIALDVRSLRGMLPKGGTMLGTRRGSPYDHEGGTDRVRATFEEMGLDALIVIGGNGSLSIACKLHGDFGLPIVGVPKTIDNDVVGTDMTFGFTTAVQIATDAIDRLHTTAESHDRVMVVEVMGRHAGWIATYAGIAGGATVILIPERPFHLDEVCALLRRRHDRGRYASIVVVAEGAEPVPGTLARPEKLYDIFGHVRLGGIAADIALGIECMKNGSSHLIYDEPIKLASNAIRGVIIAPEGKKLVISDLAQVEARVLPWLAGEQWKLEAFREYDAGRAPDNYVMAYARGFNVEPKDVDKHGRQIGKVSELSCGYGGSKAAWKSMGALYGFDLPDRQVLDIVNAWRAAHPAICDWEQGFWKQLDSAARLAIATPDKTYKAGEFIRFERHKEWLRMLLPSGSYLNYAAPAIIEDPRRAGSQTVSYMGVSNYTRKWERLTTYGGKLSADATQATAREIMGFNLPLIEFAGYLPTLLVHDEVVTETPDTDAYTADCLNLLLATVPDWATGLPLSASGFETTRYRKE